MVLSENIKIDVDGIHKPSEQQRRISIYCYYWDTLKAPCEEEWFDPDGTIATIRKVLPYHYDTVKSVLYAVLNCVK